MTRATLNPTRTTKTVTILALACGAWGVLVVVFKIVHCIAAMIGGAL